MYLDRLLLLYQRLRRDKTFSMPALAISDTDEQNKYCQVNRKCALHGYCSCSLADPQPRCLSCLFLVVGLWVSFCSLLI